MITARQRKTKSFTEKLKDRFGQGKFLCVGLDPSGKELATLHNPNSTADVLEYLTGIVNATAPFAAAFKPNRAFYDGIPRIGNDVLERLVRHIRLAHPDIPVILDNKWGDIGNTNHGYVSKAKDLGVDAKTLSPYLGPDAMEPFFDPDQYSFVLCKTSNPGAGKMQDVDTAPVRNVQTGHLFPNMATFRHVHGGDYASRFSERLEMPYHLYVAHIVQQDWLNAGLVVGATHPMDLGRVLNVVSNMIILVPGVGKQGGDPSSAFKMRGSNMILVNSSGSIAQADDPALAAKTLNSQIEGWMDR